MKEGIKKQGWHLQFCVSWSCCTTKPFRFTKDANWVFFSLIGCFNYFIIAPVFVYFKKLDDPYFQRNKTNNSKFRSFQRYLAFRF